MDHKGRFPYTNQIIDSRIYELEFQDGRVEEYSVNVILENMLDQVRSNDWDAIMFDEVISIRMGHNTINKNPGAYVTVNGLKRPIITIRGCSIQIKWKDGSVYWLPHSLVELSNPLDLAEYVERNNLSSEPAFNW